MKVLSGTGMVVSGLGVPLAWLCSAAQKLLAVGGEQSPLHKEQAPSWSSGKRFAPICWESPGSSQDICGQGPGISGKWGVKHHLEQPS